MANMTDVWDVAIVGAGTAGLPAAIFAAARGARVLLLDASDRIGGALHLSSGSLAAAGNPQKRSLDVDDSPARHLVDALRINHGTGDLAKLKLWTDEAPATLTWLFANNLDMGGAAPEINEAHEPYDVARIYTPKRAGLAYLDVFEPLIKHWVSAGRISLGLSTRMTELLTDDTGGVVGLVARTAGGETVTIMAKTVVLTTGGYTQSGKYWQSLHGLPRKVYSYPYSNGDGLTAARRIGAQVAHTEHFLPTVGGVIDIDTPGKYWIYTRNSPVFRAPREIFVNRLGRRFMAEDKKGPDRRERILLQQPHMEFWAIYDERIRREGPPFFLWSEDKVERAFRSHEDFQRADTIEELAVGCGLDAKTLQGTIDRYNAGQAVGSDEFEREHMPFPVAIPPFYAVKHHGIAVISFGGLLTDDNFAVLDGDGTPIPNLYAAGEVLGAGVLGNAYLGGMMVSTAITFGRLLGDRILRW